MSRVILHVDMDAFFAAVATRDRPELDGQPVVIGADPRGGRGRGVVSTANYAARAYGIHSAMPISQAYRACPHATFLAPKFAAYKAASRDAMAILDRYADTLQVVGLDEAYLDVTTRVGGDPGRLRSLLHSLQAAVRRDTGLTCSIGAGPSKSIAKIASDYQKPRGITIVAPGNALGFLAPLPVGAINGCGPKTVEALHALDIRTIGDLAAANRGDLVARTGRHGAWLHDIANGRDDRPVHTGRGPAKSRSNERTFGHDAHDAPTIIKEAEELARRLCGDGEALPFATLTVKLRYHDFTTLTRCYTWPVPLDPADAATAELAAAATADLLRPLLGGRSVRLVGVALRGFRHRTGQRPLSAYGLHAAPGINRTPRVVAASRARYTALMDFA